MFATTLDSSRLYERREMKDLAIKFGERIRQKRIQIGISQDKLEKIKVLVNQPVNPLSAVSLFQTILPQGVYLKSYDLNKNTLTIQAVAGSTDSFSQFMRNLQSSKYLTGIDIGDISRDPLLGIQFGFTAKIGTLKSK